MSANSAISGEVPSSHPALKTQRLLMTEALVIPEATMICVYIYIYKKYLYISGFFFVCFVLAQTLQKCWD